MIAKSNITFFVLAVGLLSLLSGNSIGIASAYPRPNEAPVDLDLDDPDDMKIFEDFTDLRKGNNYGALRNNVIHGNNTNIHLRSEVNQKHIMVGGKLPGKGNNYGAVTYSKGNTIQESDSSSQNFLGSRLTQEDIIYNVKE